MTDCDNPGRNKIDPEDEIQNIGEEHYDNANTDSDNANNQARSSENEPDAQQDKIDADQIINDMRKYQDNDTNNYWDNTGENAAAGDSDYSGNDQ